MEKKRNAMQVYALIVNIVAIITAIICVAIIASAIIDLTNPKYAQRWDSSNSTFESYKMNIMSDIEGDKAFIPDDETLREMYKANLDDRISRVKHSSMQNIVVGGLVLILALGLFLTHYRLLKKHQLKEN